MIIARSAPKRESTARLWRLQADHYSAVTAVYKGTKKAGTGQIFLRSYDSRKEPPVEPNATIWQAGRATSATALAFKPIQVGQSVFLDEGTGKYNPAPMVLDEAVCNEWPGREVGVFLSIGTGKRPDGTNQQQHLWWEGFVSGGIGDFAEARRRLIQKIEDCEKTHKEMKDHLAKRHVNPENYYRLNVNVGVGEFGMNEWNALAEISTNTRMYLAEKSVQSMTLDAAAKIARIHFAKIRWDRAQRGDSQFGGPQAPNKPLPTVPDPSPLAVELPAEDIGPEYRLTNPDGNRVSFQEPRRPSDNDKYLVMSSDEYPQPVTYDLPPRHSGELVAPGRRSDELFNSREDSMHSSRAPSFEERLQQAHAHAPPRPPKTPLQDEARLSNLSAPRPSPPSGLGHPRPPRGAPLPYPDTDGPPPVVNKATKPEFTR
tara:strand:- start:26361 stop:27647 length:1287 start_codon:yes stop_codon:yes gene_type:complete